MFKITNLKREFMSANNQKKAVLGDISIDIRPHDFISIVGPSGCGKTTFLRILAGFDKEYDGSITYSPGENGTFKEIELLGNVGFVPQEPSLFPWLTVEDNIAFGLRMQKTEDKEIEKVIAPLIDLVGLGNFRKYYPKEISGGMRQKVAICRALATNPKTNLILLDEPFSALDAQTRNTLQTDLLKIWEERNLTILFVTHNIDEAVFMSSRIMMFSRLPAKITEVHEIDLDFPRDRTSPEFNNIRKSVMESLQEISKLD